MPIYEDTGNADKGTTHSYMDVYDALCAPYEDTTANIVEIGVSHGHSLKMLAQYFKNASVYGIEIQPEKIFVDMPENVSIISGSACEETTITKIPDNIDILIDDGSHILEEQILSFKLLWNKINNKGLYIIEDIADISRFKQAVSSDAFFNAINYEILDLRHHKNRYDDVMLVARKNA